MNTTRLLTAIVAVTLAALHTGCHGLQGVRYHDGEICEDCGVGDPQTAEYLTEAEGPAETAAPHPRFHPVPTRPVFEPAESVVGPRPVRHSVVISATDDPVPTLADEEAPAVVATPKPEVVRVASVTIEEPTEVEDEAEDESEVASKEVVAEPRAFKPVEATPLPATKASSNDGWRPRVGN